MRIGQPLIVKEIFFEDAETGNIHDLAPSGASDFPATNSPCSSEVRDPQDEFSGLLS